MYIYIYIYIFMYVITYVYIHTYIPTFLCMSCIFAAIYMYIYIQIQLVSVNTNTIYGWGVMLSGPHLLLQVFIAGFPDVRNSGSRLRL